MTEGRWWSTRRHSPIGEVAFQPARHCPAPPPTHTDGGGQGRREKAVYPAPQRDDDLLLQLRPESCGEGWRGRLGDGHREREGKGGGRRDRRAAVRCGYRTDGGAMPVRKGSGGLEIECSAGIRRDR